MAIHTSVYFDPGAMASGNFVPVPSVVDQVLGRRVGLVPSVPLSLVAAAATAAGGGTTFDGARLQTPKTVISPINIRPVNATKLFPGNPNVSVFPGNPVVMRANEEITASAKLTGGSTAPTSIVAWFWDRFDALPVAESYWVAFSVALAVTVTGNWQSVQSFSFQEAPSLPAGRYAVLGMHLIQPAGAEVLCGRLVIPGEIYRPGALVSPSVSDITPQMASDGSLGVWGRFDAQLPPSLEVICLGSTAGTLNGFLRVAQIDR